VINESFFVSTRDGILLHLERSRQRSPARQTCVLVHGYGEGSYVWSEALDRLRGEFETITLDLRGHGDSHKSPTAQYNVAIHVSDLEQILLSLALQRVTLIGHSLGGQIVMNVASRYPKLVAGLVLVDISAEPNENGMRQARANLKESFQVYESIEAYKRRLMQMQPLISNRTADRLSAGALRRCKNGFELKIDPALAMDNSIEADRSRSDPYVMVRDINCPSLLIRGAGSALVSATSAARLVESLRHGQLITVPNAGHAVMSDNPDAFNEVVHTFLSGLAD
jgi:pimeloyl-ACP methyl ester carboxylesterase